MVEVMKIMATSFKRSHAQASTLGAPDPATGHRQPMPPSGDSWTLRGKSGSVWGHCSFLLGPGAQGSVCALWESVSPVLRKFWQLYGGGNGDLIQEGLCHAQVYCTQSPCPCSRPLLTLTSAGDTQTQFCPSLCGGLWVLVHTKLV